MIGTPVVATHSAVTDRHEHERLAPWISDRVLITHDLPGWGEGDVPTAPWCPAADVLAAVEASRAERVVLLGSSNGGMLSAQVALHAPPRVAGLVLLCPALGVGDDEVDAAMAAYDAEEERLVAAGDREGFAALNIAFWAAGPRRGDDAVAPDVRAYLEGTLARVAALQGELDLAPVDLEAGVDARLGEIGCPTLVVAGEQDTDTLRLCARRYAEGIPGAELVELDGVGHLPALEAPERVGPLVSAFLDRLG